MNTPLSREELELRKLDLEIRELGKQWWKHPTYIGMFSAVLLAAIGIAIALWLTYFDRERFHLKNEIERLQETRKSLEEQSRKSEARADILLQSIRRSNEMLERALKIPAPTATPNATP